MLTPIIREDLLYYIWKTKSFDLTNLRTTNGQQLEIIHFGHQNHDAGPDFSNGIINIEGTKWAGNVEMHVLSSDWFRHCHDVDKAYDNVILHVVYEHDGEVFTTMEQQIPCLELKDRIPLDIKKRYSQLIANNLWIPCERHMKHINEGTIKLWLQRLLIERMEHKTEYIRRVLTKTRMDWEETLYILLGRYMGAKVNKVPFETLTQNLPYRIIQKNRNDVLVIEALLFGQAGMLEANVQDPYFQELKKEYAFQRKKYGLKPMSPVAWKFSRMRPTGFPTIRIAQFAQLLRHSDRLFASLVLSPDMGNVKQTLTVKPSEYWSSHYRFGKEGKPKPKLLGEAFVDQLIINVLSPILFLYGKNNANQDYCDGAIERMNSIKVENNEVIRKFKALGIICQTAAESQALLELKSTYCDQKRCMSCVIGNKLIQNIM